MESLANPESWIALATLTVLEIVLGIDNIVFISILTSRLPAAQQARARMVGLVLAMFMRIALLFMLTWIMRLTRPWFTVLGTEISGRDLILIAGGLFLIGKSTVEIHHKLEGQADGDQAVQTASLAGTLVQITLLDIVFSLDSVITAVGMARHLWVMVTAVMIAVFIMVLFVNPVCRFVERHPTFTMLALSFLVLIGVALVGEGLEMHIPKGYIYFAMAFSLGVELLNMRLRGTTDAPVQLRGPDLDDAAGT